MTQPLLSTSCVFGASESIAFASHGPGEVRDGLSRRSFSEGGRGTPPAPKPFKVLIPPSKISQSSNSRAP